MARLRLADAPFWLVALAYLSAITLAEIVTTLVEPRSGLLLHTLLLLLLILHSGRAWERPGHRLLLTLALAPLIRIVSLSLPLPAFPFVYWYVITSLPLFAAAFVVMRLLGMAWRDLGLSGRGLPLQLLIGATGFVLGYLEYLILRPQPLAAAFTWSHVWLPALILLVSTGFIEELIFRRVMQRPAVEMLGRWRGLIYVSTLFAVLHIGYQSLTDVLFVFAVGLFFGWVVLRTGSLVGVTIAHGLTNIVLFLIMPFVADLALASTASAVNLLEENAVWLLLLLGGFAVMLLLLLPFPRQTLRDRWK